MLLQYCKIVGHLAVLGIVSCQSYHQIRREPEGLTTPRATYSYLFAGPPPTLVLRAGFPVYLLPTYRSLHLGFQSVWSPGPLHPLQLLSEDCSPLLTSEVIYACVISHLETSSLPTNTSLVIHTSNILLEYQPTERLELCLLRNHLQLQLM